MNAGDLMSAHGIRIGIYFKFLKLILYLYLRTNDKLFCTIFAFCVKDSESNKLSVNYNMFIVMSFIFKLISKYTRSAT
jgi:hypothetical protein